MQKLKKLFGSMVESLRQGGWSRSGTLASGYEQVRPYVVTPTQRIGGILIGSTLIGVSVTLMLRADLGVGPYDVFVSGVSPRIGISFGQTIWLVTAVLMVVAISLGERPNSWAALYVFGNGLAVDAWSGIINEPQSMVARLGFVLAAILMVGLAIAIVLHTGTTGGSFELLMRAAEKRGFDRTRFRMGLEFAFLGVGWVIGGSVGVATLIMALGIGPSIAWFSQALRDHERGRIHRTIDDVEATGTESSASEQDGADGDVRQFATTNS